MPRYIVTHSIPMTENNLKEFAEVNFPEGVSWKQTFCSFDNDKFFCEWEAPVEEVLEQIFQEAEVSFDAIYPVKIFDPLIPGLK